MKTVVMATVAALMMSATVSAQSGTMDTMTTPNNKIGKMTVADFKTANAKGGQMVAAIQPNSAKLSSADQKLLMQVAAGGQMQLALSQAAVGKVQTPEAKLLAQSEVEEQTGIAAKLKEIASAKGITLPDGPDATAQAAVDKMQGYSGNGLDAYYVKESGVKGHVKLQSTMTTVAATAKDPALKSLAAATLPVIRMHLAVSTEVSRTMLTGAFKKATGAR